MPRADNGYENIDDRQTMTQNGLPECMPSIGENDQANEAESEAIQEQRKPTENQFEDDAGDEVAGEDNSYDQHE